MRIEELNVFIDFVVGYFAWRGCVFAWWNQVFAIFNLVHNDMRQILGLLVNFDVVFLENIRMRTSFLYSWCFIISCKLMHLNIRILGRKFPSPLLIYLFFERHIWQIQLFMLNEVFFYKLLYFRPDSSFLLHPFNFFHELLNPYLFFLLFLFLAPYDNPFSELLRNFNSGLQNQSFLCGVEIFVAPFVYQGSPLFFKFDIHWFAFQILLHQNGRILALFQFSDNPLAYIIPIFDFQTGLFFRDPGQNQLIYGFPEPVFSIFSLYYPGTLLVALINEFLRLIKIQIKNQSGVAQIMQNVLFQILILRPFRSQIGYQGFSVLDFASHLVKSIFLSAEDFQLVPSYFLRNFNLLHFWHIFLLFFNNFVKNPAGFNDF